MRTSRTSIAVTALFIAGLFAPSVYAAEFLIQPASADVAPGGTILVRVLVDTEGENLNAFAGTLHVPHDLLTPVSVRDGESIITVWVDRPIIHEDGTITFSGVTPGGYRGSGGNVFSAVFEARDAGQGTLSLSAMQALLHDGLGTPSATFAKSAQIIVSADGESLVQEKDVFPPEPFTIVLEQSPAAFDGQKFLIFSSHDKGSGIAFYEVCEGFLVPCVKSSSPHPLKKQSADFLVSVRAVDIDGNVRVAYLFTPAAGMRYALFLFTFILCGVALLRIRSYLKRASH